MSNAAEVDSDENNDNVCGIAEVFEDKIKLEDCDGCGLILCGSDKCHEEHREQHEEECKKRVASELHDNKLFSQPERSYRGECPLCFLPMPLDPQETTFKTCCSQTICDGCELAHYKSNGGDRCPFCRELLLDYGEEGIKQVLKRVKANDPVAMRFMGTERYHEGDHDVAFEYFTKAIELEDIRAHYELGCLYLLVH